MLRFRKLNQHSSTQNGFILPSVVILMSVMGVIGLSTALNAQATFNNAVRSSYNQIARTASRAALDYAKEAYDLDSNYNGTGETEIYGNGSYRVTFEIEVLETQYEYKRIQATGRLYIPEISASTEFTRNIVAGIIRESAGSGSPLDYDPLVWYDASDPATLVNNSSVGNTTGCVQTSKLLYEKYNGITGSAISNLTNDADYPANPNSTQEITGQFASPVNVDNYYGARMSGQLCPPETGNYTFWVSGDNNTELWLSTNSDMSNKVRIAYHNGSTTVNQWNKYGSQQSQPISLNANTQYYIEALVKEDVGNDHLQVGWSLPNGTSERPIPASYFSLPSEISTGSYSDISLIGTTSNGNIVEQRGTDAGSSPGLIGAIDGDIEFAWDGTARGNQWAGLRFNNAEIPQGATITNAYLQFTADETKTSGNISLEIYGRDHDDPPSWSGNYGVSNATKTSASITWTPPDWNLVPESGSKQRTPNLTSIIQEIVDRPGFASDDIALMIKRNTGSGVRTAESGIDGDAPRLYVQWESANGNTTGIANDGDRVQRWLDKSGNAFHANLQVGAGGIKRDDSLNNKASVEFVASDTNAYRANLTPEVNTDTLTAFVVLKFKPTSSFDARVVSLMDASSSEDWNTPNGAYLIQRDDDTSGFRARHNNNVCVIAPTTVVGQYGIFVVTIPPGGSNAQIRINQVGGYTNPAGCSFNVRSVDQLWFGGRRGGSGMSCVGPNVPVYFGGLKYCQFLDGNIAEYIVYDSYISESQIAEVEYYLSKKWDIELTPLAGS